MKESREGETKLGSIVRGDEYEDDDEEEEEAAKGTLIVVSSHICIPWKMKLLGVDTVDQIGIDCNDDDDDDDDDEATTLSSFLDTRIFDTSRS